MRSVDPYTAEWTMRVRVDHELRQAAICRLARQSPAPHQGWLSLQVRRLACEAGYLLVALGARLEPEPSQATPASNN